MPPAPLFNRRQFLKTSAALTAGTLAFPAILRAQAAGSGPSPDRLRLAFVGVGGKGEGPALALRDQHYTAFCDVDEARAAKVYKEIPGVPRFKDYRVMLDKLAGQIDGVIISTPDGSHTPITLACMARGLHVYVEKPLAGTIAECRQLAAAAQQQPRIVTQMGIQGHSFTGLRVVKEWLDAGAIGRVKEVYLWTNRPLIDRDWKDYQTIPAAEPVPATLDWDQWLGTLPKRGYSRAYVPQHWRIWWDLGGSGAVGDIFTHMYDVVEYTLGVGLPTSVDFVEAERINGLIYPRWSHLIYRHPARGTRGPVAVHTYSGTKTAKQQNVPTDLPYWPADKKHAECGIYFVGEHGALYLADMRASGRPQLFPLARENDFKTRLPAATLPRIKGDHFTDWLNSIREGREAGANFAYSAALTEAALVGNLALRSGRSIEWDALHMRVPGMPEADAWLRPQVR